MLKSFRSGNNNETYAETCLKKIAFVAPVPRQEDFGKFDFICFQSLSSIDNKKLVDGKPFTVQVKSNFKDLVFDKKWCISIFNNLETAFLLGVVSRKKSKKLQTSFRLFSTWRILYSLKNCNPKRYTKLKCSEEKSFFYDDKENSFKVEDDTLIVALGEPILEFNADDDITAAQEENLKRWIKLEIKNVHSIQNNLPFLYGFDDWNTNVFPCIEGKVYFLYNDYLESLIVVEDFFKKFLIGICHHYTNH